MLGLSPQNRAAPRPGQPPPQNFGAARFLLPVSQVEFQLTTILEQLLRDPWPVANDKRPLRCTGNALGVAVSLLEVRSICSYFLRISSDQLLRRQRSLLLVQESCSSREDLALRDQVLLLEMNCVNQSDRTMISRKIRSNISSVQPRLVSACYQCAI